ncbi:unnamed protein product, partial [Amoebophrya sp. A25]|eukprot:GSA25T00021727001.1
MVRLQVFPSLSLLACSMWATEVYAAGFGKGSEEQTHTDPGLQPGMLTKREKVTLPIRLILSTQGERPLYEGKRFEPADWSADLPSFHESHVIWKDLGGNYVAFE